MNTSYVLFAILLFVAIVLALEGGYSVWASKSSAEAKRLAARLRSIGGADAASPLSIERSKRRNRWSWLDEHLIALLPGGDRLTRYLETSGTGTTAGQIVATSAGLGLLGFFVPLMFARPLVYSALGAMLVGVLPWWRVARRRDARIRLFEKQIPEALDLMGRAMRAGHAFPTTVQMVGEEMADPIGQEFRILFDETNYGVPQHEALLRLSDRVPVADLGYFVVAVTIQRESGSHLAEARENNAGHRARSPEAARPGANALRRGAAVGMDPDRIAVRDRCDHQHRDAEIHGDPVDRPGGHPAPRECAVRHGTGCGVDAQDHPHPRLKAGSGRCPKLKSASWCWSSSRPSRWPSGCWAGPRAASPAKG
jgi:tight adherence protein B